MRAAAMASESPQEGSETPAAGDAAETPLERGKRLLAGCKSPNDVADLRGSIAEELLDDPDPEGAAAEWHKACDARTKEIAEPKVAPAKKAAARK
jgi:hypothetical protein